MRSDDLQSGEVTLLAVCSDDFEELVCLRIEAMRESLERIHRFDPMRARERFRASFAAEFTRHILYVRHGFVRSEEGEWDIYYVRPPRVAGA